jgi:hypothetical protein
MVDQPELSFRYSASRMLRWIGLFALGWAVLLWIAWRSFDPHFYNSESFGARYAWVSALLRDSPVFVRVGIWVLFALASAFGAWVFLRRWVSGAAPLVLSPRGITAFTGAGLERRTVPWDEISQFSAVRSNLIVTGRPIDRGELRKARAAEIVVNTSMIGETCETLQEKICSYRAGLLR